MKIKYRKQLKRAMALMMCVIMMMSNISGAMAANSIMSGGSGAQPLARSAADATANTEQDKLRFNAQPVYEFEEGEGLPEGAHIEYAYTWQYAQRRYDRYENELELTESDWQACPIGSAEKIDGVFNPFYNAEEEDIVADDAGVSGKALLVKLPNGVDRRTALSKMAVRCEVRMVLQDADGAEIENSAQTVTTDQTNISLDSALLQCALTVSYTENTNLTSAAPNLVYTAVPTVTNAPVDSDITYTYTWQYYDASGWFGGQWRDVTYRNSPIKNAVISDGNLTFLLPATIAERQKLDGLRVQCKVTANAGEYTVQNSPTSYYEFGTVAVDDDLLKYTLTVTSDNSGAEVDEASDILSFKVTPALSGAASSFNSYQYDWQYMDADGNWTSISRNDENCPLRYATSTSGKESVLSMPLPESIESRKALNRTQVRCVVSVNNMSTVDPAQVIGEVGTIKITSELLTEFSLSVTPQAENNSEVRYPGQRMQIGYTATVSGLHADEAVLNYIWEYKAKGSTTFQPLTLSSGIFQGGSLSEGQNCFIFENTGLSNTANLKAMDGAVIRCTIELYANGDALLTGAPCELSYSREATIHINEAMVADYTAADWLTNAWLTVNAQNAGHTFASGDETLSVRATAVADGNIVVPDGEIAGDYALGVDPGYSGGYRHAWEYRENGSTEWKPLDTLESAVLDYITVTDGSGDTINASTLEIELPDSYAGRIRLTGMSFRCTSSAIATANHLSDVTPWGFISASTPEDAFTVLVNPKLLRSQASSTRRIVGFLTAEDAAKFIEDPESIDINTAERYDYTKSYLVKYFADGVREERATADFPENIVAVYEYQVEKDIETVETKLGAVVIPVPWRFIVQNGKQYDLGSTKVQYRYDAVLAQIIPQWNAEELQKYIDEHPDPNALDYDEDDAVKWVIAAGLNGRFPHIKVCWNTELKALANHADYVKYNSLYGSSSKEEEKEKVAELAGSPNNPYWKQTYSDWFFKSDNEFTGDIPSAAQKAEGNNEASAEAQQLAWLNEHYGSVKVLMDDVRSEESDPTPIVVELPITWTKYTVDEYDAASQSMTARWLGNEAVANMQGVRAPAAKWVWHATIDAVEDGQYVLADALRYTDIEANIYWSRVIDSIVGALINENDTATTSFVALSNAAQLNGKIPAALRVELKDANGGLNITDTIPIDHSNWKLIEGSVYDAAQQYHWRALNANASSVVDEVGTGSPAGYVAIEPTLTGYTFTENADTEMARVWYQWGTIITGLKKDGGADFDAITAAKTPIIRIPTIGGTDQTAVTWNKLLAKINKSFGVTLLDKSSATGFKPGNITPTWVQPTYDATAPAGRIQPAAQFEKPASGIVFSEDLVREFNGREPYGEISWNINPPSKTSGSTSFIKYDLKGGQPHVTGAAGQKTVYADNAWECYYKASAASNGGTQKTTNFASQDVWQDAGESVKYMVKTSERGGGAFVEYSVTFRNDSTGTRYVGLSYGSDVMIHNNDRAPLTVTSSGIKMEEASGDSCQFNINTTTATAGISVSADGYWIGVYSGRQHWQSTVTGDGNKKINGNGEAYVTGIDSGLTFSWVPQNHPLAPGESVTFTCQFGIGKMSEPPRIVPHYESGSGRSTNVTLNGSKLDISAWVAGESAYPLRLYYILDEGLPTQQSEASLGGKVSARGVVSAATFRGYSEAQKTAYFRTGTENHFVNITGTVEKPRDWVAGEYHSITIYGLSDAGLMTDSVRFPLYVEENEEGEEVFVDATDATVNFNRGTGSGTAPASQTAHLKEPIVLPKGDKLTPPSGQKFVGWSYTRNDGRTTIYPAENYFYVEKNPTTLTARYIPTSQTMYLVETYTQNASGDYEQGDTEVRIDTATSGNIVFAPDAKPGYTINTSKSKLNVTRSDGAVVQVYYDINQYPVLYHLNGAPGGDADGIFKTVQVAYGGNVSGVPNAAALNAGQNNQFFRFRGWFENADPENPGNIIDTDTIVDENTLDTIEPGGKLIAYAQWQPLGNAQITFDYNYQNHAQGASRSDKVALDPVVSETGRYGYSSKPRRLPATPSAWKDTEGKVYTFLEWRLVENGEITETVVDKDTILPNYENVTVKAVWTESYSVSRSSQGDGSIWDINDPAGGERSYAPGDTVDIRWRANPGSYVQHVYIDNVLCDDLIKNGGWHYENIHENHSVYVVFGLGEGDSGIEEETTYKITATPVGGVAFDVPERGGTYKAQYGEDYTVKWRISPGYTLYSITINGLPMDISESDNTYTFNNIHIDQEIKVTAVRSGSTIGGGGTTNRGPYTISTKIGRGTEITPNQTVAYGNDSTIMWKVPYGFVVDSVLINRVPLATPPENNTYVFRNVTQDSSIIVMCKPDPNLPPEAIYITTTIDDHGTITPTTPVGQLAKGDNHTVTWSADSGYYVSAVYIDNVLQKTDSGANKIFYSHTFTNLQQSHDVVVEVKPVATSGGGDTPSPVLHMVTTSMENGGTIDKPGSIPDGSDVTVTWRMAANHRVVGVYLDGELVDDYNAETNGNSYTIRNITEAHSLKVVCERIISDIDLTGKHIVTTTINLGASDGQKIVNDGESCTVSWTPPKGYHVSSLKVDGVEQSYVDGNSWTIPSVTKDMTVAVVVEKDSEQTYQINAEIVNGGTVSGGGTIAVGKGAILRWTVANGFRVSDVQIDGVSVAGIDLENDRSYQFPANVGAAGQTYRFTVVCAPEEYYHVRPTGVGCENLSASADPYLGDAYTVSWSPASGYRFKNVTVNGSEVTPAIAGGVYSYTFDSSNTAANATYQVSITCEKIQSYTITTGRNSGGIVSASKTLYETDAEKSYTVTWSASPGYRVKSVTVDGAPYTGESYVFNYDDGKNVNLRVEFEAQKYYTVNAVGKNTRITEGNGTYSIDADTTVKWTAPEGFVLSSVTLDGAPVSIPNGQTEYTFDHTSGLTAGHTYQLVVTYAAEGAGGDEPVQPDEFYTITTTGIFTATILDGATKKLGEDYVVMWTVLDGYQLKSVTVNDQPVTNYTTLLGAYSLTISGAGRTAGEVVDVKVTCEKIQPGQPGGGGSVITPYSVYGYANDSQLGTVTPSSATLREAGKTAQVTWAPKEGSHVVSVTISDYPNRANPVPATEQQLADGSYTFAYDDHTDKIVDVVFEKDPEYTVTAVAAGNIGEGCQVSGGAVLKADDDECTVTWTVGSGYHIESITVGGVGGSAAQTLDAAAIAKGSMTFKYGEMDADKTVTVTYAKNNIGGAPYTVRAQANDAAMGTVTPSVKSLTAAGSTCDVTWSANEGYRVRSVIVSNYPDGSNQHALTSEEVAAGKYTFAYANAKDEYVYVVFEQEPSYEITIEGVNGGASSTVRGGAVLTQSGQSHMVTWTAGAGYRVKSVVISDVGTTRTQTLTAEEVAKNSYTFDYDSMRADKKVTVTFEKTLSTVYAVTTSVNDSAMGWISPSADLYAEGASYEVSWGANDGYYVKSVTVDGQSYAGNGYTFAYSGHKDVSVQVEFEKYPEFAITTEKVGGGANSTVREGAVLTRSGETYAVTWSADSAFKVESVVITDADGTVMKTLTDAEMAAGKYTFAYDNMTSDQKLTVTFATDTSSGGGAGTIPYSVTTSVNDGSMGTIDPSATLRRDGSEYAVTWQANPGYRIKSVSIDQQTYTLAEGNLPGSYTFKYDDHKDVTVRVEFEQIPQYEVTTELRGNGGASSLVSSGAVLTAPGQAHTVTWLAGEGFHVRSVVISKPDGTDRTELDAEEIAKGSYTFTYEAMNASDRKLVVTFEKDENTTPGGGGGLSATPYTVTTSVNDESMGTVSPSMTLREAGAEYEITWSANEGYYVKSVSVDGRGYAPESYTFKYDDYKDIAVKVTFAPVQQYHASAVVIGGGAGSTVLPASGTLSKAGDTHTVRWTADAGYQVDSAIVTNSKGKVVWTCDEAEIAAGTYTFSYDEMTSDQTITVTFKKADASAPPYAINTSVNDEAMGWVSPSVTLRQPGESRITWGAHDGYRVKSVTISDPDGSNARAATEEELTNRQFVFKYADAKDLALHVEFEQIPAYTITTEKRGGGANSTVTPASAVLDQSGDSQTVVWSADTGYHIKSVVIYNILGMPVENLDSTQMAAGSYTFRYDEMNSSRKLVVTFEKDETPGGITAVPYSISTRRIGSGTVAPSKTLHNTDETYAVTWTAAEGWHVANVTINGADYRSAEGTIPESYEFSYNDHTDVELVVSFAENSKRKITTAMNGVYGPDSAVGSDGELNADGQTHTVTWTAGAGYEITSVIDSKPDGSDAKTLDAAAGSYTYQYEAMDSDRLLTVTFAKEDAAAVYSVITGVNDTGMGSITAGATLTAAGTSKEITWTAAPGYHVKNVTYQIDGVLQEAAPESPYTFNYDDHQDVNIYVEFERNTGYTVNVNPIGNGTAADPKTMYNAGEEYEVWWMPGDDAELVSVIVSGYAPLGESKVLTSADWTYDEASGRYSYTFAYDQMQSDATIDIVFKDKDYYYITTSGQNVQSISAAPEQCKLTEGSTISWTPVENAALKSIKIDGAPQSFDPDQTTLTFTPESPLPNQIYLIEVIYELQAQTGEDPAEPEYKVNVVKEGNGSVSGAGILKSGDPDREVTWEAAEGWHVSKVVVGSSRLSEADMQSGLYIVKYSDLTGDVDIKVVFERDQIITPPVQENSYTVSSEYEGNGTINDGATLKEDDEPYTVSWAPAEGWYVKSAQLLDAADGSVISQLAGSSYTFSYEVGKDVIVKVVFEKEAKYSITAVIDAGGSITPATATLAMGDAPCEAIWTISDTSRFSIKSVTLNGTPLAAGEYTKADGSFGYTFDYDTLFAAAMPENIVLKVELNEAAQPPAPVKYPVSTMVTPAAAGTITGSAMVAENGNYTAAWSVKSDYRVTKVEITENGATRELEASDTGLYIFRNIQSSCAIVVTCEEREKIDLGGDEVFYEIISGISGGTMNDGKSSRSVRKGDSYTVSWTPDAGNYVASVLVDGAEVPVCTEYTFNDISSDHTVQVNCLSTAVSEIYYVNVTSGGATTNGNCEVQVGTDHTVTWVPADGEQIVSVTVNDEPVDIGNAVSGGSYTITGAGKDQVFNIVITCEEKPADVEEEVYFDIAVTAKNCTISGETHVKAGDSTTISWDPEFGYEVKSIIIDDSARPLTLEEFTFANIAAHHSITVICERIGSQTEDPEAEYVISTHITDGGTITAPIMVKTAEEKKSQTITWSAPGGLQIAEVKIDNVKRADLLNAGSVTFTDITGNHSVDVVCKQVEAHTITVQNDNGTISAAPAVVEDGGSSTVTWSGLEGFILESVKVNGITLNADAYTDHGNGSYSLSFTNVISDHTVVVNYQPDPGTDPDQTKLYIYTHIDQGTITPTITISDAAGKAHQKVEWQAADGYRITKVVVDGEAVSGAENEIEFTDINSDHTVSVECEKIPAFRIAVDGKNVAAITPTGENLAEGSDYTVTWTPAKNMVLKAVKVDHIPITAAEDMTSYTFTNITDNHTIQVEYGPENEPVVPDKVEISVMVANGTKTGGGTLNYGTKSHTVTWAPNENYEVRSVRIDDVAMPEDQIKKGGDSITFTDIVENHSIVIVCELPQTGEEPDPDEKVYLEANITNGMFDPDNEFGVYEIEKGTNFEINWTPNEGYRVVSVKLDDVERPDLIEQGSLKLINVSGDHSLIVDCRDESEELPDTEGPFTITTSIDHGSISDSFTTDAEHNSYTVSWTVDSKYEIVSVMVDGNPYANAADGYVDFNPITANHTVDVRSQLKDQPVDSYTINVVVDNGGTHAVLVDGSEADYVNAGASAKATWKAADGYDVTRIVIDGVSYNSLPNCDAQKGEYTFNNVAKDHEIVVYTSKHVEKEPVYYGITVLPHGDPSGLELSDSLPSVLEGTQVSVTWKAKPGWRIDKVTRNNNNLSADEMAAGMTEDGFTFTVNANNDFVVYVSKQGPVDDSFVTVSTEINNGWISNGGSVKKGSSFDVSWRPGDGYKVDRVTITDAEGNTAVITEGLDNAANWKHVLNNITSNTTVTVNCIKQPADEEPIIYSYQIDTEATNGTIAGGGTVTAGADREIRWTPAEGCVIKEVHLYEVDREDGYRSEVDISSAVDNRYTIRNIDTDYLVVLICENESHSDDDFFYDVQTKITNGTINGPFLNLRKSEQVVVSWTPADDCYVKTVIVDGKAVSIPADNQLEVAVEGDDHVVEVICEKNKPLEIPDDVTPITIETYIYDGIGEITPKILALPGSDAIVQWKVGTDNHYKVDRVYVDGESVEVPESDMLRFTNLTSNHKVEVYLAENLVNVEVSYEGNGEVVKSGTVYWGENFGIVRGVPNEGYRLESVILNGRLLQQGEIITELLPDENMPLPGEEEPQPVRMLRRAARALSASTALLAARDYTKFTENEFQNTFYFRDLTEQQSVKYIFVDDNGASDYAPYQVSVELVDGRGERDVAKNVTAGANTSIGWKLDDGYYIDHISIVRNNLESSIDDLDDAQLTDSGDRVSLNNVQANTVVKVYLKRGTEPDPKDANDFSLSIDVVGPGSNDPDVRVYGAGRGMAPGAHEASWAVGSHKVTMVKVDGEVREDLIGKYSTTINMDRDDVNRDHYVVVYLDGEVLPGLEKKAEGSGATVGDVIPYTITVWNDTDQAIWENVTVSDVIPAGLQIDRTSMKLYRVAADGSKTEVVSAPITYEDATRLLSVTVGDIGKTDRYELSFTATVMPEAAGADIGNAVTARGTTSGTEESDPNHFVEATTQKVYPGNVTSVVPKAPDAHLTKTVENSGNDAAHTHVGDTLTYTIDAWNSEPGSVWKNVKIRDEIPEGLQMLEGSVEVIELVGGSKVPVTDAVSVQYDTVNRTLMANLGDLEYSKHYQVRFKVFVAPEALGNDIGNIAIAAGTAPDKTPISKETDPVYPNELDKPENGGILPAMPDPVIAKAAQNLDRVNEQSAVGDTIEYTLTVRNNGFSSVWENAVLRDRIPEGLEIDAENIVLKTADRETVLDPAVYDEASRILSVYLGDIAYEQQYQVVFTAKLVGSVEDYDIGNLAWANGKEQVPGVDENTEPGDPYFDPDDDWADEGGPTTEKVYPNEEDRPQAPGAKLTKTSRNLTHPAGKLEIGDVIEYEIEIANTQQGSAWRNVTVTDLLPVELTLEEDGLMLIHPDGTVEPLELSEVYDEATHSLTLTLADSVRTGGTYWLRYSTKLSAEHLGDAASVEIINKALASGVDIEGQEVVAEASDMIQYEKPAEPEKPGNETQDPQKPEDNGSGGIKTGDTANVTPYLLGLLAAIVLLALIVLLRVQKGKKK